MEEIILAVVRDLPSTAVLILFLWFTSKQFQQAIGLTAKHLEDVNKILELCIESKHKEEEKEFETIRHLLEEMLEKDSEERKSQGV